MFKNGYAYSEIISRKQKTIKVLFRKKETIINSLEDRNGKKEKKIQKFKKAQT